MARMERLLREVRGSFITSAPRKRDGLFDIVPNCAGVAEEIEFAREATRLERLREQNKGANKFAELHETMKKVWFDRKALLAMKFDQVVRSK